MRPKVDFPEPLSPTRPSVLPASRVNVTFSTACSFLPRTRKVFETFSTCSNGLDGIGSNLLGMMTGNLMIDAERAELRHLMVAPIRFIRAAFGKRAAGRCLGKRLG
ncbi:hypothetical protein D3C86_1906160 [compost metagenome]